MHCNVLVFALFVLKIVKIYIYCDAGTFSPLAQFYFSPAPILHCENISLSRSSLSSSSHSLSNLVHLPQFPPSYWEFAKYFVTDFANIFVTDFAFSFRLGRWQNSPHAVFCQGGLLEKQCDRPSLEEVKLQKDFRYIFN